VTNPHALGRYKYGTFSLEKVKQAIIMLRMIAPEWSYCCMNYSRVESLYGVQCGTDGGLPAVSGFVLIDYERMEIDPNFIQLLNNQRHIDMLRSRSNAT